MKHLYFPAYSASYPIKIKYIPSEAAWGGLVHHGSGKEGSFFTNCYDQKTSLASNKIEESKPEH